VGALYRLRGIRHRYGRRPALSIDALEVAAGAVLGVVGPNGSGKSTLLKLMAFVEFPSAGEIRFKEELTDPFAGRLRDRVALLPQEPFLLRRDVAANVAYGLRLRGQGIDPQKVREALSWVGLDAGEFARRPSHALSGGEAQRVALAARLILRPEVLLLDEPTTSVDAFSARLIRDAVLRARADWGTTLVIASHDRQWLAEISDTRLHLFRGRATGNGRENLLFGPWRPLERGWGQLLDDGQQLLVPEPPAGDAIAVLERVVLALAGGDESSAGRVLLNGTVARMALENSTGDVQVEVRLGGLTVTVGLAPERARGAGLFPGGPATVGYDLVDVKWMPANGAI
jgi:tungstate transport system ATP-binding protein